jgi:hypothetical protein
MGIQFNPLTGFFDLTGSSSGGGTLTGVADSNSINFSVSGGTNVTGDVKLSAVAAVVNNKAINLDIQADGIRAQIPNSSIQDAALNLLGPVVLTDNSSGTVFSFTAASNLFTFVDYSIGRGSNARCGRVLIVTDGAIASIADAGYVELSPIGVSLGVSISVGVVSLTYATTSTGTNCNFKYSIKQWS